MDGVYDFEALDAKVSFLHTITSDFSYCLTTLTHLDENLSSACTGEGLAEITSVSQTLENVNTWIVSCIDALTNFMASATSTMREADAASSL